MKSIFFTVLFPFAFVYGSWAQGAASSPNFTRDNVNAVLWQQKSAEYRALAFQGYNIARLRLDQDLRLKSTRPRCIVVDIDETVLDNSAFEGHELQAGKSYDPADWLQWTAKAAADTVPGALAFLNYAASKKVEVFYITNRSQSEFGATLTNLLHFRFPFADAAHLLVKDESSDKEPRRQKVAATHHIVLLCGDNLNDFADLFYGKDQLGRAQAVDQVRGEFGKRFIILPNPMYGDWESPVYDNKKGLTEEEKAVKRMQVLKGY